jgi:hypothetical protein
VNGRGIREKTLKISIRKPISPAFASDLERQTGMVGTRIKETKEKGN